MKNKPSDPNDPMPLEDCCPQTKKLILMDSERVRKNARGATAQKQIPQMDIEELLARKRLFEEWEEEMAVALAKGAEVEPGVHTMQLVPCRTRSGFAMKLVVK